MAQTSKNWKKLGANLVYNNDIRMYLYLPIICCRYFWGYVTDKFGRRPVLLVSATLTYFATLFFGFSTNLYFAITARFLQGLMNGRLTMFSLLSIHSVFQRPKTNRGGEACGLASSPPPSRFCQQSAVVNQSGGGEACGLASSPPHVFVSNQQSECGMFS